MNHFIPAFHGMLFKTYIILFHIIRENTEIYFLHSILHLSVSVFISKMRFKTPALYVKEDVHNAVLNVYILFTSDSVCYKFNMKL